MAKLKNIFNYNNWRIAVAALLLIITVQLTLPIKAYYENVSDELENSLEHYSNYQDDHTIYEYSDYSSEDYPNQPQENSNYHYEYGDYNTEEQHNYQTNQHVFVQSIDVEPSTHYEFNSDYHHAESDGELVIEYLDDYGKSENYFYVEESNSTNSWEPNNHTFITDDRTSKVNFYIEPKNNEHIEPKKYEVHKTSEPIQHEYKEESQNSRALISIDFDDGWMSSYERGFPILEEYGYKGTAGIVTNYTQHPEQYNHEYMSSHMVQDLHQRGHDIASHSLDHSNLTSLSKKGYTKQLQESKSYLESLVGKEVNYFITPYCDTNEKVTEAAKKIYSTGIRNCEPENNSSTNFDKYNIHSFPVINTTTIEEITHAVEEAKHNHSWLVLVYHKIDHSDKEFSVSPETLRSHLELIKDSEIEVVTSENAVIEFESQGIIN